MVQGYEAGMEEILLTMDVVDSIRHESAWLASQANTEERSAGLKQRLARLYRQQGIEVKDDIIQAGIDAQMEKRFVHRPATGFWPSVAKIYVERMLWLKRSLAAGAAAAVVYGLYFVCFVLPLSVVTDRLNTRLADLGADYQQYIDRHQLVEESIAAIGDAEGRIKPSIDTARRDALTASEMAADSMSAAAAALRPPLTTDEFLEIHEAVESRIIDAETQLTKAGIMFDTAGRIVKRASDIIGLHHEWLLLDASISEGDFSANYRAHLRSLSTEALSSLIKSDVPSSEKNVAALATSLSSYETLRSLREDAQALRDAGLAEARNKEASDRIQALYANAIASLNASDLSGARVAMADLRSTIETVVQSYSLRIVSGGNAKSGVWRHPNNNRSQKNYYLIVEAINDAGRIVRLPINNEETGWVERVTSFGVRVPEEVFERVKADKLDNQLIDNPSAGEKRRGEISPRWEFPVAGGYITNW